MDEIHYFDFQTLNTPFEVKLDTNRTKTYYAYLSIPVTSRDWKSLSKRKFDIENHEGCSTIL